MGYVEAFKAIESTFTEAIVISDGSKINQNGVYIFYNGSKPDNKVTDILSFAVVVAANSYTKENNVMEKVNEMRLLALDSVFDIDFKGSKGVSFENSSLYIVALEFTIKINVKENDEIQIS